METSIETDADVKPSAQKNLTRAIRWRTRMREHNDHEQRRELRSWRGRQALRATV
jgi:hypothetical protein